MISRRLPPLVLNALLINLVKFKPISFSLNFPIVGEFMALGPLGLKVCHDG